ASTNAAATVAGSRTSPAVVTAARPRRASASWGVVSEEPIMAVSTPIGHRHATCTPRSPYVAASHSAKPTAACLVAEYVGDPSCVSKPAAEAVVAKHPPPPANHRGTITRAATTCAITFTFQEAAHASSAASRPNPENTPALATHTSTEPKALSLAAMTASISLWDVASAA